MQNKIQEFLEDLAAQNDGRYEIVIGVRELVKTNYPETDEVFKYGGLVYQDESSLFTGIFARKKYITVELVGGAYIEDIYGCLEGKGGVEGRKHIRLFDYSDIVDKHLEKYLALVWETR